MPKLNAKFNLTQIKGGQRPQAFERLAANKNKNNLNKTQLTSGSHNPFVNKLGN